MKRRLFLRQLGLGMAGTVVLAHCTREPLEELDAVQQEMADSPADERAAATSVIIIGAGAAGMYAASWLKAKGVDVTIFESSDRRGGRIKSMTGFADFTVEAGAEVIHGSNSMWYQWATQQGATFVGAPFKDFYRLDGILKTQAQAAADPDVQAAWAFENAAVAYTGANDLSVAQYMAQKGVPARVHHIVNADLGNDYGTHNGLLSVKGITQEDAAWTAGNTDYFVKNRSFAQILDTKCANILPFIQYNKKVVAIDHSAVKPKVKDQNGVWHEANAVIVTVPLTILQQGDITFTPALPTWKTTAINNIGMGAGMKIILKFNQRFWDANLRYIYGEQMAPMFWYTSKQRGADHVLTAFVMGEKAAALSAQGAAAVNTMISELNQFYGNNVASASLLASHIEDWSTNPHIRGAYSFAKVNGGGLATRQNLFKKLNNKVHFAGEACNYKGHNSTVHGALETGLLAARNVWNTL